MKKIISINHKFNHIKFYKNIYKNILVLSLIVVTSSVTSAVFATTSLMDVYHLAQKNDAILAQATAQYEAQQQGVLIARSPLLPQITADGVFGNNNSSINSGDVTTKNLSITLNQSLYNPESRARYQQSKYQQRQSSYTLQATQQDLIIRTADIYFAVLLAQANLELFVATEQANKTQWERAQVSADVGMASKVDVLQAKSSYDLSRSDRILAENDLDVAYEKLLKLTGQELKQLKKLKTVSLNTYLPKNNIKIEQWESEAKSNNLAVLKLEQSANIAAEEISVQRSAHWFNIGLQARYSRVDYSNYNNTVARVFSDKNDLYIGAYVSLPIYSGGRVSAKVSEARSNLNSANEGLRYAREQASLDARIQARNVARGHILVDALREAVKSNDAFLEAAEEGHKVGLKSLLEVLTARSNKFKARRDLTRSMHNVILSGLRLEGAAGNLTPEDLIRYDAILSSPNIP